MILGVPVAALIGVSLVVLTELFTAAVHVTGGVAINLAAVPRGHRAFDLRGPRRGDRRPATGGLGLRPRQLRHPDAPTVPGPRPRRAGPDSLRDGRGASPDGPRCSPTCGCAATPTARCAAGPTAPSSRPSRTAAARLGAAMSRTRQVSAAAYPGGGAGRPRRPGPDRGGRDLAAHRGIGGVGRAGRARPIPDRGDRRADWGARGPRRGLLPGVAGPVAQGGRPSGAGPGQRWSRAPNRPGTCSARPRPRPRPSSRSPGSGAGSAPSRVSTCSPRSCWPRSHVG